MFISFLAVLLTILPVTVDEKPLTPAEAIKHVNEKCTVEMEVKSVGKASSREMYFLNSNVDFQAADNFQVMLGAKAVEGYKRREIPDIRAHFTGKTIRITGTVKLFKGKPEIVVNEPEQIIVVEKTR